MQLREGGRAQGKRETYIHRPRRMFRLSPLCLLYVRYRPDFISFGKGGRAFRRFASGSDWKTQDYE
jgi:hypothetical protein